MQELLFKKQWDYVMLETTRIMQENAKEKQFCNEIERETNRLNFCKVKIIRKINERVKTVNKILFVVFTVPCLEAFRNKYCKQNCGADRWSIVPSFNIAKERHKHVRMSL